MNFNIISKLSELLTNELKRKPTIILDPNPEKSYRVSGTVNDIVMWSNRYSTKIGTNTNTFEAKNYAQANEILSKVRLYSEKIAAKSASQNIILRFYPKTLRTINKEFDNSDGGALKFDRTIPQQPAKNESPDEEFFGDMIYGI